LSIVTIFSGSFCAADAVAAGVAEKLGLEPVSDALFEETRKRSGLSVEKLRRAVAGPAPFWNQFTHEREKAVAWLRATAADILDGDGKLLQGYAAHLVPSDIPHILRVCIIANFPHRAREAAGAGLSRTDAETRVRADDAEALQWTQYLFDKPPYDEGLYDMVVAMQDSTVEDAVAKIRGAAQGGAVRSSEVSRLAFRDFQLAAKVNLALALANHDVDVSARGEVVTVSLKHPVMRMSKYEEDLRRVVDAVDGVRGFKLQMGAKYKAPSVNTMANIDLPPKILLVDDEKEFVDTLSERLKKRKFDSAVVYDGARALESVESDQPDVVVLDLMMPGIDGLETLKRLKKSHPKIEVIILTGHGSEKEEQNAAELGAFAYLQKPVNIELLARTMREAYQKVGENA